MKDFIMNMDSGWLDEFDPELVACLTCHVELEAKGTTYRPVVQNIAAALRETAAKIESGLLDTGFHDLESPAGEKLGEVYLDYSGEGVE
jgi:hypothetical protein